MKRVFQPQNAVDFLTKVGFNNIECIEDDNSVVDFKVEYNGAKHYAYAANYSMSAYNRNGIVVDLTQKWQDYLCKTVEGYPELLIKHLERKADNSTFLYEVRKERFYCSKSDEQEYENEINLINDRINFVKNKYEINGLKK